MKIKWKKEKRKSNCGLEEEKKIEDVKAKYENKIK